MRLEVAQVAHGLGHCLPKPYMWVELASPIFY